MSDNLEKSHREQQLEAALAEVQALETLAWEATYGWANTSVLTKFRNVAFRIRSVLNGYGREKLSSMLSWAEILYSARKHQQWDPDGANVVRGFLVGAIQGVEWSIEQDLLKYKNIA